MASSQPIYEGVVGANGKRRDCRCGEPAAYSVTKTLHGDRKTFDVCVVHFRALCRDQAHPLVSWVEFLEYSRHIRRMRVWVKDEDKPQHTLGGWHE